MSNFFYTLTPELKEKINRIRTIHNEITLLLINPQYEIKSFWEASKSRINHALILNGFHSNTHTISKMLHVTGVKKETNELKLVLGYKKVFDYARQNWYISDERISENTLHTIVSFFTKPNLQINYSKIEQMLGFVQVQSDNPVIQASLIHALIEINQPYSKANSHLSLVLPYLFLYKQGLYFRGMLDIEEYRLNQKHMYEEYTKTMRKTDNVSGMIEFYTNAIMYQAEELKNKLKQKAFKSEQPESFFQLNDRQKHILALFDEPGLRLTNRKVQELFEISQITASRDLAKLAELGLIFSSGKGRSVFYTKI